MPKCCGVFFVSLLCCCCFDLEIPDSKARKNLNFLGKDCIGPTAAKVLKLSLSS